MKVISILQPWATLAILGYKRFETRSWDTKFRGKILIHASAKFTREQERLAREFFQLLNDSRIYHCHLGAILGQVEIINTHPTEAFTGLMKLTDQERAFGDYSPNRYGWELANPIAFDSPVPAKGKLGIWEYPDIEKVIALDINDPDFYTPA